VSADNGPAKPRSTIDLRPKMTLVSTPTDSQPPRSISLRGVRVHNLKGIDLALPLYQLIAVTGVSGAGKSSLAFDTLYAEGQRRYVETFSPYTRQFFARLDKPDADQIVGIPPAIAVGRPHGRHSTRSTISTITEVHDSLALLFARAGEVVCRNCGQLVSPASPASVSAALEAWPAGTRYEIGFPLELRAHTDRTALFGSLQAEGFTRIRALGKTTALGEGDLALPEEGVIDVIVDRLVRGHDPPERRTDSIETAFAKGLGRCRIIVGDDSHTFLRSWRCSRCETDHIQPQPNLFRYNGAIGACPVCEGFGRTMELDISRIVPDPAKTLRGGAIAPAATPAFRGFLEQLLAVGPSLGIPLDVPFQRLSIQELERLKGGVPGSDFTGLVGFVQGLERRAHRVHNRVLLARWRRYQLCSACQGARLRPEALAVKIAGTDIVALSSMTIRSARAFIRGLSDLRRQPAAAGAIAQIDSRLGYLGEIGLDYLSLDRPARSLSGGELQRVILTKTLGSGLVNTLYVLDEPTVGLHPQEVGRLVKVLHRLRDQGNTLLAVEHDRELILGSDHVVDLGPGAGASGGQVLYSGPLAGLSEAMGSATNDYVSGRRRLTAPAKRRAAAERAVRLRGATGNNLKSIDVVFPLGVFCVVTGASGAGKSTLIEETLYPALRNRVAQEPETALPYRELEVYGDVADVVFLDQAPLARLARSNPATHLKVFDEIRRTFAATHEAKLRNYDAGKFSFNVDGGRCSVCRGNGFLTIDMQFLPDVMIRCPECLGTRYRPEVLEITYRSRNIAEVLELTAREAFLFFRNRPRVQARLRPMLDIGLDYLRLGQPVATLSGGEAQRLRLAGFLARTQAALYRTGTPPHTIFLLDEPTAGLHPLDIVKLLEVLNALVDRGHSLIVIEHHPDVMVSADWIIDLGPGAGDDGGRLVAQGTPEEVAKSPGLTGQVIAAALGAVGPKH
jgi:excinuclease ABC subunit A